MALTHQPTLVAPEASWRPQAPPAESRRTGVPAPSGLPLLPWLRGADSSRLDANRAGGVGKKHSAIRTSDRRTEVGQHAKATFSRVAMISSLA